MRRPSAGSLASYGVVVAMTTGEGALQFLTPPLLDALGYPISLIGFLYALSFGVALLVRLPAGLVYRPWRARWLIAGAVSASAAMALLYPHAPNAGVFAALRTVHGAALGVATTVSLAHFLGTHGSGTMRGRAMAYYATALSGGYVLGNGLGGIVAAQWGYAVGVASAALWFLVTVALTRALPPVTTTAVAPSPLPPGTSRWAAARRALSDPGLAYTAIVSLLLNVLFHVPGTFFPLYALRVGLGLAEIGFIRASFAFTNTAVRGVSAHVLERVGRRPAQTASIVCQVAGLALLAALDGFLPLFVCLMFVGFWRAVGLVANTIALAEDVDPTRVSRGVASGVYSAASDVGALAAPAIGGLVAAAVGLDNVFRVLPGFALAVYVLATVKMGRRVRPLAARPVAAEAPRG
jgi:MFS family permease